MTIKASTQYNDLPREELLKLAEEAHKEIPGVTVHFRFTCEKCGERCAFHEPNILYGAGECYRCGHMTKIVKGGFMLQIMV